MIKRLLMIDEMNNSLRNGIVCFKVEEDNVISHFFFTRNRELISYLNNDFSPEMPQNHAYDVLNNKTLELKAELFDGEVYSIAHCHTPSDNLELKNVKIYIGNKTGAIVISDKLLEKYSKSDMDDFGIKDDNKFFILSACLGLDDNTLEDIYLVNEEGEQ